jgi:hypothetical protein
LLQRQIGIFFWIVVEAPGVLVNVPIHYVFDQLVFYPLARVISQILEEGSQACAQKKNERMMRVRSRRRKRS